MTDTNNQDLENKLQEAQAAQEDKATDAAQDQLLAKIAQLEAENKELSETCKRAQLDYINLKADMDLFQRRMSEKENNMQVDTLIDTVKKFLPFVEELRKSLENITENHKEDPLTKGLQLTYDKFLKKLEELGIQSIACIGLSPDSELHEPVSMVPTEDKKLKGKIIQEFARGFIYKKGDIQKVITAAKVVIGQ